MKVRDSGMPPEDLWSSFFDVTTILTRLQINNSVYDLMEVGCGYGTFTIPAAKRISGRMFAFDIEQQMIDLTREKSETEGLNNIDFFSRDIIDKGSGLKENSMDYVMLFNIMHHERPLELLKEVYIVLKRSGKAGIIHWRSDIRTPRGPDLSIRPRPEQCIEWSLQAGFTILMSPVILEPYHFGLIIQKP